MSSYISYMGTDTLDGGDLDLASLTADDVNVRGDISVNGTVDGVDISVLDYTVRQQDGRILVVENEVTNHEERITTVEDEIKNHEERITTVEDELSHIQLDFVDKKTAQTIGGVKTFTSNIQSSNILANGYIDCTVLTASGNVRGVNFLSTGFSQVRDANSTGQVIQGMSIRGGGRSQQFFLSNGDGVSETYYGSDLNGSGTVDANQKWCISSRQASDGRLIFYRAPFYTGSSYDPVMDFKNTLNPETKSYDCTINMHKPVNFNSGVNIGGMPFSHFYTTDNWQLGGIVSPGIKMRIGRSGRNVTMNIGPLNPVNIPGSDILITAVYALDAPFHPSMLVENLFMITQNNKRMPAYVRITTDGVVNFWMDMNGSTTVQNPVRWSGFSTSWLA